MQAFVPKTRKPKFELRLRIIDLNNVPLVSGTSYVKWHLPSSTSAEHRGRTNKSMIKEHKVCWDYEKLILVRLTADRNAMLHDCEVHFEVLQEYSSGARGERIVLGNIKLNLSEYVDGMGAGGVEEGEEGVTRRYLMQESKINSTLKISILMRQIEGDRTFIAPPLKTAPVFGGIAGIMIAEPQGESDDVGGQMPYMSSKTRELGELQDVYRRTLAASWAAQAGELPADKTIENLFAGEDGWGKIGLGSDTMMGPPHRLGDSTEEGESEKDTTMSHTKGHRRIGSGYSARLHGHGHGHGHKKSGSRNRGVGHSRKESRDDDRRGSTSEGGRGDQHGSSTLSGRRDSLDRDPHASAGGGSSNSETKRTYKRMHEVDEFEAREDLRSWEIEVSG